VYSFLAKYKTNIAKFGKIQTYYVVGSSPTMGLMLSSCSSKQALPYKSEVSHVRFFGAMELHKGMSGVFFGSDETA